MNSRFVERFATVKNYTWKEVTVARNSKVTAEQLNSELKNPIKLHKAEGSCRSGYNPVEVHHFE